MAGQRTSHESTPPATRGWAFGVHRAMDHLGAAIGPVLATLFLWFYPGQYRWLFALTIVPGLIAVAMLLPVTAIGMVPHPPLAALACGSSMVMYVDPL